MPKYININTATVKQLQQLEGIGPILAKRIVDFRRQNGTFESMFDLLKVPNISSQLLLKNKDVVVTSSPTTVQKPIVPPPNSVIDWLKGAARSVADGVEDLLNKDIFSRNVPKKSFGTQRKKTLKEQDIRLVARMLGVEAAALKAVIEVESSGGGFLKSGRPKILFEGHVFWNFIGAKGLKPKLLQKGNEDILYPTWTRRFYKGGEGEYERLNRAKAIHEEAALSAASWGMFQVMGFNYRMMKYPSVQAFVKDQYVSEFEHLKAFMAFIENRRLVGHLRNKNWAKFASGYNGRDYRKNRYDEKLAWAYRNHIS